MTDEMVVLDVWGGECSGDHLARRILPVEDALEIARKELSEGYLVNLRNEVAWGDMRSFDARKAPSLQ